MHVLLLHCCDEEFTKRVSMIDVQYEYSQVDNSILESYQISKDSRYILN